MNKTEIRAIVSEVLKTKRTDKDKTAMENWVAFIARLDMYGRKRIWDGEQAVVHREENPTTAVRRSPSPDRGGKRMRRAASLRYEVKKEGHKP